MDSRLSKGTWEILSWKWEVTPTVEMLEALEVAVRNFKYYLSAESLKLSRGIDTKTKLILKSSFEN
jgi:hypothetical protein